jgi:hypothetical protein
MEQKIFDNTIIAQYAMTGVPLKVYVSNQYLTITDASDVENPLIGHGMLPSGEMAPFSYPSVEHLLVANNIINLETYNTAMADQFKSDEPEEAPEGDEEAPEEEGEDDTPDEEVPEEEEPTTEEGFKMKKMSLSEISKDVLKAKMDVIKQQEKELKNQENALKKEPIDELTNEGQDARTMLRDLHFEIDPARQKKMKIKLGREKYGAYSDRSAIEDADYALGKYRRDIEFGDGTYFGVFLPGSYDAATSKLGDGPHKKAVKRVNWNQQKYDQWIDDVSKDGGVDNSYDMARNAKNEPGLIDWVKKNVVFNDETPLERIQYDIEAMAESVNENEGGTIANQAYSFAKYFGVPVSLFKGFKFDGTDDIDKLHGLLKGKSSSLEGTKNIYNASLKESVVTEGAMKDLHMAMDNAPNEKAFIISMFKNTKLEKSKGAIEWLHTLYKEYKSGSDTFKKELSMADESIIESKGAGLSKEETLEVAKKFAEALSIIDGVKVTVNMTTLDEDSFDLDYDGYEFEGGSYNIYDDGAVKNMAVRKQPIVGTKDDDVKTIVKYMKKHYGKLDKESVNESRKFTPGDKYSPDFDYEGMLAAGLKVNVNTPIELLNKLFDSFTDVNYHTEAKGLGIAIDYIEDGDKNGAIEYMDMFHKAVKGDKMIKENVSSPYIYQIGDLVQNVNPTCPHHGSKGIVVSIEPEELTYSVTNSGDTFRPGMRLTKTLDQLETM